MVPREQVGLRGSGRGEGHVWPPKLRRASFPSYFCLPVHLSSLLSIRVWIHVNHASSPVCVPEVSEDAGQSLQRVESAWSSGAALALCLQGSLSSGKSRRLSSPPSCGMFLPLGSPSTQKGL